MAAAAAAAAATPAQPMRSLPSGLGICTTAPDVFYLPELVFGGLVWILLLTYNPLGWVMFVSVFCFIMTLLWMIIFAAGGHKNKPGWAAADFAYHGLAAFFYLSAAVHLAFITIMIQRELSALGITAFTNWFFQTIISAVVFAFLATFFYFVHTILSAIRWKRFSEATPTDHPLCVCERERERERERVGPLTSVGTEF